MKKDRLKILIAKSKAKLEHLWKELHFSDEQREQFYSKTKSNDAYDDAYLKGVKREGGGRRGEEVRRWGGEEVRR